MNSTIDPSKLIILDRDGVINQDSDHYIKSLDEWIAYPSSLKAIARLNEAGVKVAIATNQSGVSRGFFSEETLHLMHEKLEALLKDVGGHIDAIEYCIDHPDKATTRRKPGPDMVNKLLSDFKQTANTTWFVGDSKSDIDCALNAGCLPLFPARNQRFAFHPESRPDWLKFLNLFLTTPHCRTAPNTTPSSPPPF